MGRSWGARRPSERVSGDASVCFSAINRRHRNEAIKIRQRRFAKLIRRCLLARIRPRLEMPQQLQLDGEAWTAVLEDLSQALGKEGAPLRLCLIDSAAC